MTEKQPIRRIDPKVAQPMASIDQALNQPDKKPFNDVPNRVFHFQLPEFIAMQEEAAEKIRKHLS